jgi:transposase
MDGVTTNVKVAHVRLCRSRMVFVRAYPRETQEMVFDAHDKAFAFFGGACARGLHDSETLFAIDGVDGSCSRHRIVPILGCCQSHHRGEPSMDRPTTIGIDLAKSVFQAHGVDADGAIVVKRKRQWAQGLAFFPGLEPCRVGMEACAGAHFRARELQALGHEVRIMPPSYVKPYVKRGKTDGETGPWPQMRPRKPVERCRGDLR